MLKAIAKDINADIEDDKDVKGVVLVREKNSTSDDV